MFCSLKVILRLINKQVSYTQLAFEWLPIDNTGQDYTNPLNLHVTAEDECFLTKYYVPYPLTFLCVKYRIKSQNNVLMSLYYLCKKYITKNENSSFIDNKCTNYCLIMDQYLVWYPLALMMAVILCGMDSKRKLK